MSRDYLSPTYHSLFTHLTLITIFHHHHQPITSPSQKIPEGDWFCATCRPRTLSPLAARKVARNIKYKDIDSDGEDGGVEGGVVGGVGGGKTTAPEDDSISSFERLSHCLSHCLSSLLYRWMSHCLSYFLFF